MTLSVIQTTKHTWRFVGSVPTELAFVYESLDDLKVAKVSPTMARLAAERAGRKFAIRTWATREEAISAAEAMGFKVNHRNLPRI